MRPPTTYRAQRLANLEKYVPGRYRAGVGWRLVSRLLDWQLPWLAETLCTPAARWLERDDGLAAFAAYLAWAREDGSKARAIAERMLRLHPRARFYRWLLVTEAMDRKEYDQALGILGPARPGKEAIHLLYLRIGLHIRRGDLARASELNSVAQQRFPAKVWPLKNSIRILTAQGDFNAAARRAEEALAQYPTNAFFAGILSDWCRIQGDDQRATELDAAIIMSDPGRSAAAVSLGMVLPAQREKSTDAIKALETYEAHAEGKSGSFKALRQIALVLGREVNPAALARIAHPDAPDSVPLFDSLLARTEMADFPGAVVMLQAMLEAGDWDFRLLAYLRLYRGEIASPANESNLPPLDAIEAKLRCAAQAQVQRTLHTGEESGLLHTVLATLSSAPPTASITLLCPIHRPRDVTNLLEQVDGQALQGAQVVFCVSNPDIAFDDLRPDASRGHRVEYIRAEPGLTVGNYLNRCLDVATGEYVLRFDADDTYAPHYGRYMIAMLEATQSDVVSMDLCSFFFDDIGQTYLVRAPMDPAALEATTPFREGVGSGSSLCARRRVFEHLRFDEERVAGEDILFYRQAVASGLAVKVVPGYFHTALRHSDKTGHTWHADDFNLLGPHCCLVGDGRLVPEPGTADGGDPYQKLFQEAAFSWAGELNLGAALRTLPRKVTLVTGRDSPVDPLDHPALQVRHEAEAPTDPGGVQVIFQPQTPDDELKIAQATGSYSMCNDVLPALITGQRERLRGANALEEFARGRQSLTGAGTARRYLILSNPRSGSEHLCSLLHSTGLGQPRELLRKPLAHVMTHSEEPERWLDRVFGSAVDGPVFGTKIISHYLLDDLDRACRERLARWLAAQGFHVVRLYRDRYDSAVSNFVAAGRYVWHHRVGTHATAQGPGRAGEIPPYDFDALADLLASNEVWTQTLDAWVNDHFPGDRVLELDYNELNDSPETAVDSVFQLLALERLPGTRAISAVRPIHHELPEILDYRARFRRDAQAANKAPATRAG